MVSSRNPNFCLRFETWVMYVTKFMLSFSSLSLLHSVHVCGSSTLWFNGHLFYKLRPLPCVSSVRIFSNFLA